MFTLHLTNFPIVAAVEYATFDDAIAAGRAIGFEFSVQQDGRTLCGLDHLRGLISFEDPRPEPPPFRLATLAGRCSNGYERDRGRIVHAIARDGDWRAICGRAPGRTSAGWSDCDETVTAPTCLACRRQLETGDEWQAKRLARAADAAAELLP